MAKRVPVSEQRRYTFKVGMFEPRRVVTVRAPSEQSARVRAAVEMTRRKPDGPVMWDFELVELVEYSA